MCRGITLEECVLIEIAPCLSVVSLRAAAIDYASKGGFRGSSGIASMNIT
jgi:hypothetical protein